MTYFDYELKKALIDVAYPTLFQLRCLAEEFDCFDGDKFDYIIDDFIAELKSKKSDFTDEGTDLMRFYHLADKLGVKEGELTVFVGFDTRLYEIVEEHSKTICDTLYIDTYAATEIETAWKCLQQNKH